jgi:hypothetical protein
MIEHVTHQHTIATSCTDGAEGCPARSELTFEHEHSGGHAPHSHDVAGFDLAPLPEGEPGHHQDPALSPVVVVVPPPPSDPRTGLWADRGAS